MTAAVLRQALAYARSGWPMFPACPALAGASRKGAPLSQMLADVEP
jgi:hypothetical protein